MVFEKINVLKRCFVKLYKDYKEQQEYGDNKNFRGFWADLVRMAQNKNINISDGTIKAIIKRISDSDKKIKVMFDDINNLKQEKLGNIMVRSSIGEMMRKGNKAISQRETEILKNIFVSLYNNYKSKNKDFKGIWTALTKKAEENGINLKYAAICSRIRNLSEVDNEIKNMLIDIDGEKLTEEQKTLLKFIFMDLYSEYKINNKGFYGFWEELHRRIQDTEIHSIKTFKALKNRIIKMSKENGKIKTMLDDIEGVMLSNEQIEILRDIFNNLYDEYNSKNESFFGFWENLADKADKNGISIRSNTIKDKVAKLFIDDQEVKDKINKIKNNIKQFNEESIKDIAIETFLDLDVINKEKYKYCDASAICDDLNKILLEKGIVINKSTLLKTLKKASKTREVFEYINKYLERRDQFTIETFINKYNKLQKLGMELSMAAICREMLPVIETKFSTTIESLRKKVVALCKKEEVLNKIYEYAGSISEDTTSSPKPNNRKFSQADNEILKNIFIELYNKYNIKNKGFGGIWSEISVNAQKNGINIKQQFVYSKIKKISETDEEIKTMFDDIKSDVILKNNSKNKKIGLIKNTEIKEISDRLSKTIGEMSTSFGFEFCEDNKNSFSF